MQLAVDIFGRLDVLVNNAGYGAVCAVRADECGGLPGCREHMLLRHGLHNTRPKQKSGHIFQVSSVGDRLAVAGNTPYHAAKWAVGGFSDALAMEVAPFGVKICPLEPGGIRSNWARHAGQNASDRLLDYAASVGSTLKLLRSLEGCSEVDPRKIADVIVQLANSDEVPVRLILVYARPLADAVLGCPPACHANGRIAGPLHFRYARRY